MEPEDVNLLMKWENSTENWGVSGTLAPFNRAAIEAFVKQSDRNMYQTGQLRLMIQSCAGNNTIGTIDLFDFDPFHHRAGVGILIALPEMRGQGLASESLKLLKEYAFSHLDLNQLYCNVLCDNSSSVKLFEASGFVITGEQRQWIRINDHYQDQYFMQLLKNK